MTKPTMMTYILEEHEMAERILSSYPEQVQDLAKVAAEKSEWLVLATGSSYNAALSAKYGVEQWADVRMDVREPFPFTYYDQISPHTELAIGISQTGHSTSTIGALNRIRRETELPTVALTADVSSAISAAADTIIDIGCGEERVGYVTKGFLATVLTLMLTALRVSEIKGVSGETETRERLDALKRAVASIPDVIVRTEAFFAKFKEELAAAPRFLAIGCGPAAGTLKEFETKFIETVRVPSQGIELEAFMHGPYLEVNPEHRFFFLETKSPVIERLHRLREYESRISGYVYTVSLGVDRSDDGRTLNLDVDLDERAAPLLQIVPFQVLAHHIAEAKGIDLTQRIYTDFGMAMKSKTQPGNYA